ncbi:MAG: amidohydrolase family protein, partial [Anaerolineae bacterium]
DFSFFVDPTAQSKIRQGVTTEITGNCGGSAAPWMGAGRRPNRALGVDVTWTTMEEYIQTLVDMDKTLNHAPLVGQGTIRNAVVGREDRASSEKEMIGMERLLAESLEAGAVGMSLGLYFAPGMYAIHEELVRLFRIVGEHGKVVAAHIRDEGTYTVGFVNAVKEFVGLGRESGVPVHISHLKAHGPEVWGTSEEVLELIDEARAQGVEVTADQYPYEASGGGLIPDTLPHAFQAGRSTEDISRDLARPETRAELHDAVETAIARRGGADRLFMSTHPKEEVLGKSIQQLSEERGTDPASVVMDLLVESEGERAGWTCFSMHPDDVERFMRYPAVMVGSDGSSLSTEGPLSRGNPHPRNFGTHARILGLYVRDKGVLRFEDAVRKMTSLPAQTFGIAERGAAIPGNRADLVLFDLEEVTYAGFEQPKEYPEGIPYVMCNGQWVIAEGEFTGNLPGRALAHGRIGAMG